MSITYHDAPSEIASIEAAITKNGGVLDSYGYGFSLPSSKPARVGGWEIRLVDRRGMGNHGSYVAVAMEPETFRFQWNATKRVLHGLAEAAGTPAGENFATTLIPVLESPLLRKSQGAFLFVHEGWAYFANREENFQRVGWDTYRIWRHLFGKIHLQLAVFQCRLMFRLLPATCPKSQDQTGGKR